MNKIDHTLINAFTYLHRKEYTPVFCGLVGYQDEEYATLAPYANIVSIVKPPKSYFYNRKPKINDFVSSEAGDIHIYEPLEFLEALTKGKYRVLESLYTNYHLCRPSMVPIYDILVSQRQNLLGNNFNLIVNSLEIESKRYQSSRDPIYVYHAVRLKFILKNIHSKNPFLLYPEQEAILKDIVSMKYLQDRNTKETIQNFLQTSLTFQQPKINHFNIQEWKEQMVNLIMSEEE